MTSSNGFKGRSKLRLGPYHNDREIWLPRPTSPALLVELPRECGKLSRRRFGAVDILDLSQEEVVKILRGVNTGKDVMIRVNSYDLASTLARTYSLRHVKRDLDRLLQSYHSDQQAIDVLEGFLSLIYFIGFSLRKLDAVTHECHKTLLELLARTMEYGCSQDRRCVLTCLIEMCYGMKPLIAALIAAGAVPLVAKSLRIAEERGDLAGAKNEIHLLAILSTNRSSHRAMMEEGIPQLLAPLAESYRDNKFVCLRSFQVLCEMFRDHELEELPGWWTSLPDKPCLLDCLLDMLEASLKEANLFGLVWQMHTPLQSISAMLSREENCKLVAHKKTVELLAAAIYHHHDDAYSPHEALVLAVKALDQLSQVSGLCDDVGAAEAMRGLGSFDVRENARMLKERQLWEACEEGWEQEVEERLHRIVERASS